MPIERFLKSRSLGGNRVILSVIRLYARLMKSPKPNYRWRISIAFSVVFALIGFGIGWSIDTKHPDNRLADILIPTSIFLTAGLLIGYVTSGILYKRFSWFDATAILALPPTCFFGFVFAKSGNWTVGRFLGYVALGFMAFLVWRLLQVSHLHRQTNTKQTSHSGFTEIDD
jgi:hypothetical protein